MIKLLPTTKFSYILNSLKKKETGAVVLVLGNPQVFTCYTALLVVPLQEQKWHIN